jgi:hypothetical protein
MLVTIFCEIDDFCKSLVKENQLYVQTKGRKPVLQWSEILTIIVFYHHSGFKNFKYYYNTHVKINLAKDFPNQVSYNRFVELMQQAALPLMLYFNSKGSGACTGISIIDSMQFKGMPYKTRILPQGPQGLCQKRKDFYGMVFWIKNSLSGYFLFFALRDIKKDIVRVLLGLKEK